MKGSKTREQKVGFETEKFKMVTPKGVIKPVHREIEIIPEVARIMGYPHVRNPFTAVTKTMGPFPGKLFVAGQPDPVGILDDVTYTVTKMDPQGTPFLFISLSYTATSKGWATHSYSIPLHGGGPYTTAQFWVYFKNRDGGIIYIWTGNAKFALECGWQQEFQVFNTEDHTYVDWFDVWESVTHEVKGVLYPC